MPPQARVHFPGKRAVLPLGRVSNAEAFSWPNHRHQAIVALVDLFDEPAVMQDVKEAETHPFAESRSFDDVTQPQHLPRRLKRLQNRGSVHKRLHEVPVERSLGQVGICG